MPPSPHLRCCPLPPPGHPPHPSLLLLRLTVLSGGKAPLDVLVGGLRGARRRAMAVWVRVHVGLRARTDAGSHKACGCACTYASMCPLHAAQPGRVRLWATAARRVPFTAVQDCLPATTAQALHCLHHHHHPEAAPALSTPAHWWSAHPARLPCPSSTHPWPHTLRQHRHSYPLWCLLCAGAATIPLISHHKPNGFDTGRTPPQPPHTAPQPLPCPGASPGGGRRAAPRRQCAGWGASTPCPPWPPPRRSAPARQAGRSGSGGSAHDHDDGAAASAKACLPVCTSTKLQHSRLTC